MDHKFHIFSIPKHLELLHRKCISVKYKGPGEDPESSSALKQNL